MNPEDPPEPPVSIGQKLELEVVDIGEKGDKIVKIQGYVIFVPTDKEIGHMVSVEIIRALPKVGFAVELNKEVDENLK